jgi:hypothetical protein
MKIFYTYLWLREDGTPYYVGKGCGCRAFKSQGRRQNVHPPADKSRVLIQDFLCEQDAFAAEIFLISYYGRKDLGTGCLVNLTEGGEGASGHVPSLAARQNMSAAQMGRKHPDSVRQKMSLSGKGRIFTKEHLQNLSRAHRGFALSEEHKQKISQSGRGLKRSEATKQKMREVFKGRIVSQETRQRIAASLRSYYEGVGKRKIYV